jgi:hypothetical protein
MNDDTQQPSPRQPDQIALSVTDGPVTLPAMEREMVMHPSPWDPASRYWLAVQSARDALSEAAAQLREARRLHGIAQDEPAGPVPVSSWLGDAQAISHIDKALEVLPTLPTTGATLAGGCIDAEVDAIASGARRSQP